MIKYHLTAKDNQPNHHLSEDFYVDNLVTGADNIRGSATVLKSENFIPGWTYRTGIPAHLNQIEKLLDKIAWKKP